MSINVNIDDVDLPADVKTAAADEIERIIADVKRLVLANLGAVEDEIDDETEIADLQTAIAMETRTRWLVRSTPAEQEAKRYEFFFDPDAWSLYSKYFDIFLDVEHTDSAWEL